MNGRTPFASHSRMLYHIEVCYQQELARPEGAQGDVLKSEFWSMLHRKPLNPKPERHAVCNLLQDQAQPTLCGALMPQLLGFIGFRV